MGIFSMIGMGLGLAMDAFAVSLTIGMSCHDKRSAGFTAALYFGLFQAFMPLLGWLLGVRFTQFIVQVDHYIAFILLLFIGGKMLIDGIKNQKEPCQAMQKVHYSHKNYLLLAIATSIDALAVGVTLAFLQVNILFAITLIGAITMALSFTAVYLGERVSCHAEGKAEILGGLILIAIGAKIFIEHMFF